MQEFNGFKTEIENQAAKFKNQAIEFEELKAQYDQKIEMLMEQKA